MFCTSKTYDVTIIHESEQRDSSEHKALTSYPAARLRRLRLASCRLILVWVHLRVGLFLGGFRSI